MALTKCKDCLLFDESQVEKHRTGICAADGAERAPNSRCPGALPNVDQDTEDNENA